jgi:hypothetical protein
MKGRGLGMVMLVVVMAIVLYLVARNWQAVAPTAMQVAKPGGRPIVDAHGEEEAANEVRSRNLPDLKQMDRETDAHAADVKDALQEAD